VVALSLVLEARAGKINGKTTYQKGNGEDQPGALADAGHPGGEQARQESLLLRCSVFRGHPFRPPCTTGADSRPARCFLQGEARTRKKPATGEAAGLGETALFVGGTLRVPDAAHGVCGLQRSFTSSARQSGQQVLAESWQFRSTTFGHFCRQWCSRERR